MFNSLPLFLAISRDICSVVAWAILILAFILIIWSRLMAFDKAIAADVDSPSLAIASFHRWFGFALLITLVLCVLLWWLREPLFVNLLRLDSTPA